MLPPTTYFIAFMYVVIYHLKQKPHHIPQDECGDQVPVDNIPQASDTPKQGNTFKSSYRVDKYTYTLITIQNKQANSVHLQNSSCFIPLHYLSYTMKQEVRLSNGSAITVYEAVCSLFLYQAAYLGLVPFSGSQGKLHSQCQRQNLDFAV